MTKTYEMMWDCSYCDTKKLLGKSHKHCPNCGTAQDSTKRYFPPDSEKVAVEDHKFVGKDKICGFCEAPNSALAKFCTECAGPMDGTKDVALVGEEPKPEQAKQKKQKQGSALKWVIGFVAIIVAIGFIFSIEEDKGVTVTGHSWSRSIEVEQYKEVTEEAWEDRVPLEGKIKSCREKERDTEKVPDGETCSIVKKDNGDGTYRESEECQTKYKTIPIYDDWCTYKIKKWTVVRTENSAGKDLQPNWPTVSMNSCDITALSCEREGQRTSVYAIQLQDEEGKNHECSFAENKWKSIQDGTSKVMGFGAITGLIDCDTWDAH